MDIEKQRLEWGFRVELADESRSWISERKPETAGYWYEGVPEYLARKLDRMEDGSPLRSGGCQIPAFTAVCFEPIPAPLGWEIVAQERPGYEIECPACDEHAIDHGYVTVGDECSFCEEKIVAGETRHIYDATPLQVVYAPIDDERDSVVETMAHTILTYAWADEMENRDGPKPNLAGEELTSYVEGLTDEPYAPSDESRQDCLDLANDVITDIEWENECSVEGLYAAYCHEHGEHGSLERFAHYLAMESMETGAAWSDDYPEHGVKGFKFDAPTIFCNDEKES